MEGTGSQALEGETHGKCEEESEWCLAGAGGTEEHEGRFLGQSTEGSRLQPGGNREPQSGLIQQERDGQHVFAVHRHCQAALPKRAGAGFIRLWPVQPAQRKSPRRELLNDYRVTRWRTGDFWTHSYGISCLYI